MSRSTRPLLGRLAVLLLLGTVALTTACVDDDTIAVGGEAEVTVMTRNLYLGGDIFRLTTAQPQQIPLVVAQLFGTVQVNSFQTRATALAAEIEANAPDLIGLQEVTMYRLQDPGDYLAGVTTPNAEVVFIDYLEVLLDALEARGLNYVVVSQVTNADVELPAARSSTEFFDVRLTDRDVILAREGVQVAGSGAGQFGTLAPIPVGGQVLRFPRGYTWAAVAVDGVPFMFVNTHLEVSAGGQLHAVQAAQSYELTAAFGRSSPLVMVGDFNTAPGDPPYNILAASFTNAWAALPDAGEGFTCCFPEVLLMPGELDERIDHIFYRGAIDVLSAEVLGDEPSDRVNGLWPSDHAGVVATLQIRE